MICTTCNDNSEPNKALLDHHGNAFECSCKAGVVQSKSVCEDNDKLPASSCNDKGQPCGSDCSDQLKSASLDKRSCVPCDNSSTFDLDLKDCICNNPLKIMNDASPVSTRKIVEIYDPTTGLPVSKGCYPCPKGTAVITFDVLGSERLHSTAGEKYRDDPYTCARCPDESMYFNKGYECVCNEGLIRVGESSVGTQSCIQYMPTISKDYAKVEMHQIKQDVNKELTVRKNTIDSLIFSHFYLKAASICEFSIRESDSYIHVQACQTLANLCVMTMYDIKSTPCQQFQSVIMKKRANTYHGQEDWKLTLPWLYYLDESDDIVEDHGINMIMSLTSTENRAHKLHYKVAKYTIAGEFKGLFDLSSHFFYCYSEDLFQTDTLGEVGINRWNEFGKDYRNEYKCDLSQLLDSEMFFYDLYVVDSSLESCQGHPKVGECLYPVPVLIRNLVNDDLYPNMNSKKSEEYDDVYTRRFFLVDNMVRRILKFTINHNLLRNLCHQHCNNLETFIFFDATQIQSGKTSSGNLGILRYAKSIVLQNTIQLSQPNKIYPPKLIIEYAEIELKPPTNPRSGQSQAKDDLTTFLLFRAEYTMNTKQFWARIKTVLGFISAMSIVICILRIYHWVARNKSPVEDRAAALNTVELMSQSILIFCHTVSMIGFPFIFTICLFFFIFFKLQEDIFIMLPSDLEYYGIDNEYFFFSVSIHIIFWFETIYILYLIYKQCNVNIFFIDWERPKDRFSEVSSWRMIMVINEWNKLQCKRNISIEFNLLAIAFFMIGLDMYGKTSSSQPDFESHPNSNINIVLRFASNSFFFLLLSLIQLVWRRFLERFVKEAKVQRFVDLSTVAKISLFITDERFHGYYLHCRSPYEQADCSMEEICQQISKEEKYIIHDRGLHAPNAPPDCQSYEFIMTSIFVKQLERGFAMRDHHERKSRNSSSSSSLHRQPNEIHNDALTTTNENGRDNNDLERTSLIRREISEFLKSFIDQSPYPSTDGLVYMVRERQFVERIFGVSNPSKEQESKCSFYADTHNNSFSFLKTTFIGIEVDLLLHDIMVYNIIDLLWNSPSLSCLVTYLIHLIRNFLRSYFGRRNLSHRSLVDERFIH